MSLRPSQIGAVLLKSDAARKELGEHLQLCPAFLYPSATAEIRATKDIIGPMG